MRTSDISERLGLFIETSGISQKELSKMAGVPDSAICRAIKRQNTLSAKNIIKISEATRVSPNWLLGFGSDEEIEYI